MKNNAYDYFDAFSDLVSYSCDASILLNKILIDYRPGKINDDLNQMHVIEHNADIKKHELMSRLLHEFITPIEREDIVSFSDAIDNVTDAIEDVIISLYIYNITDIRIDALAFSELIIRCCTSLKDAVSEIKNFKKSAKIKDLVIEVNRLEEEGDKLYIEGVRNIFMEQSKDVSSKIVWKETFEHLEVCCDACEHVADVIETIIMKNS